MSVPALIAAPKLISVLCYSDCSTSARLLTTCIGRSVGPLNAFMADEVHTHMDNFTSLFTKNCGDG
jgi:hypothetical protein